MGKKGDISLWFLIELVGAFLIGYLAVDVSLAYAQGTIYEKLNIAKDLAMQINTLSGITGNAYIVNRNIHGYSINFISNRIEVFENDLDQTKGVFYFIALGNTKLNSRFNSPKQIVISKINDEIKISEDVPNLR